MAADSLSTTLFALADPTRRGILARLATGDATVKELAKPYDMSLAAVSKHLKVLEGAGLISRGRDAQWRPCHLETEPLQAVSVWLEDFRRFWDRSLDALTAYLDVMDLPAPARPAAIAGQSQKAKPSKRRAARTTTTRRRKS
jgi:DNA-binding transcriptional ArsR family regulator